MTAEVAFLRGVFVVLAALLVPLGLVTSWVHSDVDDTATYVEAVGPLSDDPRVRAAIVDAVAGTTLASLQENVPVGLPDAVDELVEDTTSSVVGGRQFPGLWREANRLTHAELRRIAHDDGAVEDGTAEIDLDPVLDRVLDELAGRGVPVDALPELHVGIDLEADRALERGRGAYVVADGLRWWPLVGAVLLAAAAIGLSRGLRGRLVTGAVTALLASLGAGLVLLARGPAVDVVSDAAQPSQRDLVRVVLEALTDSLHELALYATVGGVVLAVALGALGLALGPRRTPPPAVPPPPPATAR